MEKKILRKPLCVKFFDHSVETRLRRQLRPA